MVNGFHYILNLTTYFNLERYFISIRTHRISSNEIRDQSKTNDQHCRASDPKKNYANIDVVTGDVEIGILVSCRFHNPNPDPECYTQQTSKNVNMQVNNFYHQGHRNWSSIFRTNIFIEPHPFPYAISCVATHGTIGIRVIRVHYYLI